MATKASDGVGRRAVGSRNSAGSALCVADGSGLDAKSLDTIGRSLRAHYEDLVRAPVPGKFLEMFYRLEATELPEREGGGNEAG
jgi:hypothetical protein